jgi:hypothetical protein
VPEARKGKAQTQKEGLILQLLYRYCSRIPTKITIPTY